MAPVLAYWKSRGFAQPIRLLLAYAGVEFEDKQYVRGPPPEFAKDPEWVKDKEDGLGLDFPDLPYYIDEDVKLTQSLAIVRFLARKHGLVPDSEEETTRQDLAEYQIVDFWQGLVKLCYYNWSEEEKQNYLDECLPKHLQAFAKFLGDRTWLTGEKLTFVDFLLYETLDWNVYFAPDCLKEYPNLAQFVKRLEDLPTVKAWLESDRSIKWPIFLNYAKWGNDPQDQLARFPTL